MKTAQPVADQAEALRRARGLSAPRVVLVAGGDGAFVEAVRSAARGAGWTPAAEGKPGDLAVRWEPEAENLGRLVRQGDVLIPADRNAASTARAVALARLLQLEIVPPRCHVLLRGEGPVPDGLLRLARADGFSIRAEKDLGEWLAGLR